MERIEKLEITLFREKEIFDTFVNSSGRSTSLLPFIEKYSQEDGVEYTIDKIKHYLNMYLNSRCITDIELKSYEMANKLPAKVVFRRGLEIYKIYISSRAKWQSVLPLKDKYAKEDGRLNSYDLKTLQQFLEYYLHNTKETVRQKNFDVVTSLAKRSDNGDYDIELLNELVKYENIEDAVSLVKEIGISAQSIKSLYDLYKTIYPANTRDKRLIESIINSAFSDSKNTEIKFGIIEKNTKMRLNNLCRLLEEYLASDEIGVSVELLIKYNFSEYSFNQALKDASEVHDNILQKLLYQYHAKEKVLYAEKIKVIEAITRGIMYGVYYNETLKPINAYDYYSLTNLDPKDILSLAQEVIEEDLFEELKAYLTINIIETKKYTDINAFKKTSTYKMITNITEEEKEYLLEYLLVANIPISSRLFKDLVTRYVDQDFILEIETEEEVKKIS